MTDRNHQSRLLSQLLELPFPEAETGTVAATTIGGDEERGGSGVVVASQSAPPAPDRSHGEGSRVVVHSHTDPAEIASEIVHAIGDRFALLGIQEVMDLHLLRLSLRPPRLARILEPPDELLLLGVHRNGRLATLQLALDPLVDVLELRIPIRVSGPLQRLPVRL
jgi:hypothetical protein